MSNSNNLKFNGLSHQFSPEQRRRLLKYSGYFDVSLREENGQLQLTVDDSYAMTDPLEQKAVQSALVTMLNQPEYSEQTILLRTLMEICSKLTLYTTYPKFHPTRNTAGSILFLSDAQFERLGRVYKRNYSDGMMPFLEK